MKSLLLRLEPTPCGCNLRLLPLYKQSPLNQLCKPKGKEAVEDNSRRNRRGWGTIMLSSLRYCFGHKQGERGKKRGNNNLGSSKVQI
jgi:hypothetical protein